MKSVMKHQFAINPTINAPRSMFNRSFGHKTSFDASWLIPVYWDEVLPGDTFNCNATMFTRMATPAFPLMDNLYLDSFFFFVPYRLVWDNFRKFCGEQIDPGDSIDYTIPILGDPAGTKTSDPDLALSTQEQRSRALLNYMGVPTGVSPADVDISSLPFRCYSRIYNEWFRDGNLIDSQDGGLETGDGNDDISFAATQHPLQKRGKRFDYFTQALSAPQKGDAVNLPLGTSAPIIGDGTQMQLSPGADTATPENVGVDGSTNLNITSGTTSAFIPDGGDFGALADLSSATAATVNDIREAVTIQQLLEQDARGGTRYSELVLNHFGVNFYDVSYRPEYLGGNSTPIQVNPVHATGGVETDRNVGDLGAYALGVSRTGFTKSFVEHGIVMGIVNVRADLTYQQGLNRFFSHSTRYDLYWPALANLGEQAVLNKEIYVDTGTPANNDLVFGYVPRHDEYRFKPSMITGKLASTAATPLDSWHVSQEFSSLPTLGQTFIEEDVPIDRVINVSSEPHFIFDSYFNLKCARPMPTYAIPGLARF